MNAYDSVKNTAGMFLYIFINPDAGLNKKIMRKRENQITLLKRLASASGYNYSELEKAVRDGIVERYGTEPDGLLELLQQKYSIGAAETGTKTETSFWDDLGGFLNNIGEMLNSIGNNSGNSSQTVATIQPDPDDWNNSTGFSLTGALPYLVAGGIVLYLVMGTNDNDHKTKKRKN